MLADRHYMRGRGRGFNFTFTEWLMMSLVAVFAFQCINDVYFRTVIERWLALTPLALARGWVWQFLTFQFLHGGLLHLGGNLLGLWFFGRFIEGVLGVKRYLLAYFGSGVVGGLLQCILMLLFPNHFPEFVYGASAGVMGVFAIFCLLQSDTEIRWNFILPIRADVLLWITAGISLFFTIVPSGRGGCTAHAAHLGGILAGLAFVKMKWHEDFRPLPWHNVWANLAGLFRPKPRSRILGPRIPHSSSAPAGSLELQGADFISKEVDPILDKISQHGIQSLTERERKILDAARSKMAKR